MKRILFFLFLLTHSVCAHACDICNVYSGITPSDFRNSFGIMYRSRYLKGNFPAQGLPEVRHAAHQTDTGITNGKELFNVAELRFRLFGGKKKQWNHLFILPLVNNYRSLNGYTQFDVYGLGDPTIISNRILFNTQSDSAELTHRLSIGAGVKLPFGGRKFHYLGKTADLDMQGSSGSTDFLFTTEYIGKKGPSGWIVFSSYKINTSGTGRYRYGNSFNLNLLMFYQAKLSPGKILMPNWGFLLERADADRQRGALVDASGGRVGMLHLGLDYFSGRMQWQFSYQPGLFSVMNGQQFPLKNRCILGMTLIM